MVRFVREALVLIASLATLAGAVNNTFYAAPYVNIRPPFLTTSKLLLKTAYLTLDHDDGVFYANASLQYSDQNGVRDLHLVSLSGYIFFQNPGLIRFGFEATNCSGCCTEAAVNSPSMCPYLETLLSGSFSLGPYPNDGSSNTERLDIELYADPSDPNTGKLMNFFGAYLPFSWDCAVNTTCESMTDWIPPVPLPANAVRRQLSRLEQRACKAEQKRASAAASGDDSYFEIPCGDFIYICKKGGCVEKN